MLKSVNLIDAGLIDYKTCWDLQEKLFQDTIALKTANRNLPMAQQVVPPNYLIVCEHPSVFTLGKSGKREHLLISQSELLKHGIQYYPINRGGDITYHGPGQLVVYPIIDLDQFFTDIHKYLRLLEEAVIQTCHDFGIQTSRYEGYTGVWMDVMKPDLARKICAMGVRCSRWVTMHGLAFNVNVDLLPFNYIIPCGIEDKKVTSLHLEVFNQPNQILVKEKLLANIAHFFQMKFTRIPVSNFVNA